MAHLAGAGDYGESNDFYQIFNLVYKFINIGY